MTIFRKNTCWHQVLNVLWQALRDQDHDVALESQAHEGSLEPKDFQAKIT